MARCRARLISKTKTDRNEIRKVSGALASGYNKSSDVASLNRFYRAMHVVQSAVLLS